MIDPREAHVRPDPEVLCRCLGDETILVQVRTDEIYSLNVTAGRWWQLTAEGLTAEEVRSTLLGAFEVSEENLDRDLGELVDELMRLELLVAADGSERGIAGSP